MDFGYQKEKEEALIYARDRVAEAVQTLEDFTPDVAEELGWIRDHLTGEILSLQSRSAEAGEGAWGYSSAL